MRKGGDRANYLTLLGRCPEIACDGNGTDAKLVPQARSLEPKADALLQPSEDGALMASYSVFVLEPGERVGKFHEINKIFLTSHIPKLTSISIKSSCIHMTKS